MPALVAALLDLAVQSLIVILGFALVFSPDVLTDGLALAPGQRVGYAAVPPTLPDRETLRADVLVTDRSVVDNFAYYLRVTGGEDPFAVEPLIRRWAGTYDLSVRLLPDVGLLEDGVRSTNDAFRDEIEAILDRILPIYLAPDRCVSVPASDVTADFDWWGMAERLAAIVGAPLVEGQLSAPLG